MVPVSECPGTGAGDVRDQDVDLWRRPGSRPPPVLGRQIRGNVARGYAWRHREARHGRLEFLGAAAIEDDVDPLACQRDRAGEAQALGRPADQGAPPANT